MKIILVFAAVAPLVLASSLVPGSSDTSMGINIDPTTRLFGSSLTR